MARKLYLQSPSSRTWLRQNKTLTLAELGVRYVQAPEHLPFQSQDQLQYRRLYPTERVVHVDGGRATVCFCHNLERAMTLRLVNNLHETISSDSVRVWKIEGQSADLVEVIASVDFPELEREYTLRVGVVQDSSFVEMDSFVFHPFPGPLSSVGVIPAGRKILSGPLPAPTTALTGEMEGVIRAQLARNFPEDRSDLRDVLVDGSERYHWIVIVDNSGSMGGPTGTYGTSVVPAVNDFTDRQVALGDAFSIIVFGSEAEVVVECSTGPRHLDSEEGPDGGTVYLFPLKLALGIVQKETVRVPRILFFTDGCPEESYGGGFGGSLSALLNPHSSFSGRSSCNEAPAYFAVCDEIASHDVEIWALGYGGGLETALGTVARPPDRILIASTPTEIAEAFTEIGRAE